MSLLANSLFTSTRYSQTLPFIWSHVWGHLMIVNPVFSFRLCFLFFTIYMATSFNKLRNYMQHHECFQEKTENVLRHPCLSDSSCWDQTCKWQISKREIRKEAAGFLQCLLLCWLETGISTFTFRCSGRTQVLCFKTFSSSYDACGYLYWESSNEPWIINFHNLSLRRAAAVRLLVLCHLTQTFIDLLTSTLQQQNPAAHFTWHPQPLHSKCTLQSLLFSKSLCSLAYCWLTANDTGSVSDLHERHLATPPSASSSSFTLSTLSWVCFADGSLIYSEV